MLNFPVPYPDELIYSTVARAGVRFGITSPKQLLDEVFSDRKIIATVDLPSHLEAISSQYPTSLGLTAKALAYKHTLFPLYAPFVPEKRRRLCLKKLAGPIKGAVHLALGVAASRVKQNQFLKHCPGCLGEQLENHGEYYWKRQWQAPGCSLCLRHSSLAETQTKLRNYHRHAFVALSPDIVLSPYQNNLPHSDKRIELRVQELLSLAPIRSPRLEQWSLFYKKLAHDNGITRGDKVIYEMLQHKVLSCWATNRLQKCETTIDDNQSSWLRMIMRKHRKSFSYLEHIIVLESLLGSNWEFKTILNSVKKQTRPKRVIAAKPSKSINTDTLNAKRMAWIEVLRTKGIREGRLSGKDYLYTWLYRNDRRWLMEINKKHRKTTYSENRRIDWMARDLKILKRLETIRSDTERSLDSPRQTKSWYCAKAECRSYAKKMHKLPLSSAYLETIYERVADYQIRRINLTLQTHDLADAKMTFYRLLRLSGLSEERLRLKTREFLRHSYGLP